MRVLITGGAGFIGFNLAKRLKSDNIREVVLFDDLSSSCKPDFDAVDAVFVEGSILDRELLHRTGRDCDAIVHLAAQPSVPISIRAPLDCHAINADGTLNVLELARDTGAHVTVASSAAVYGPSRQLPLSENAPPNPISPYAASKLAAEAYASSYQHAYGVPVLPLRFFNVYGPGQHAGHAYASVIPAFIDAAIHGRPLPIFGDGQQTRDFVFVDTITEAISLALRKGIVSSQPVNLASGEHCSLLTAVETIEELLSEKVVIDYLPPREGDIRDSIADITALRNLLPDLEGTSLRAGIGRTLDWFLRPTGRAPLIAMGQESPCLQNGQPSPTRALN